MTLNMKNGEPLRLPVSHVRRMPRLTRMSSCGVLPYLAATLDPRNTRPVVAIGSKPAISAAW